MLAKLPTTFQVRNLCPQKVPTTFRKVQARSSQKDDMKGSMSRSPLLLALLLAACDRSAPPASTDAGKPASSAAESTKGVHVVDPGSEPRLAPPAFVFQKDRTESGRLVLDSRLERNGTVIADEHLEVVLDIRYTSSDKLELVVKSASTTASDIPRIGSSVGTKFVQKIYPSGELEPPEPSYPAQTDPIAGDYVRGAVVQIASNFLPLVPKEPVGAGARWTQRHLRYSLVERRGEKIIVERRGEMQENRPTPTGMALAHEVQLYRIEAIPDGIARRVEAELVSEHPPGSKRTTRMALEVGPRR